MFSNEILSQKAREIRLQILDMVHTAGSGHIGGSFSAVEILLYLYLNKMNIRHLQPLWEDRDRFIMSKGHATPVYYSVLAEAGFFSKQELKTFRQINSRLQGHPDMKKIGSRFFIRLFGTGLVCGVRHSLGFKKQRQKQQGICAARRRRIK